MPINITGWATPPAPPSDPTFVSFTALTSEPFDGQEWSTGHNRVVRDPTTGDLCMFLFTQDDHLIALWTSPDNGVTWAQVASNMSNPESTTYQYQNRVLSVAIDSAGKVHMTTFGKQGNTGFYYFRFTLTRSGGHVTGYSRDQASFALPDHGVSGVDIRGSLYVMKRGGVEVIAFVYGFGFGNVSFYGGISSSTSPTSAADFTGFTGSGGDTLLFSGSGASLQNHDMIGLLCQNETTEDIFFVFGHINADEALGGSGSDFAIKAKRLTKSGSNWSVGSSSDIVANGAVIPHVLDTDSASDKAWVMYNHPSQGVSFGYFDSGGTWHGEAVASLLGTSGRAAFGTFTAGDDSRLWAVVNNFGTYQSLTPDGRLGYYNGTSWDSEDDLTAQNCTGIAGVYGWNDGIVAVRFDGDVVAQTVSGISVAGVYGP